MKKSRRLQELAKLVFSPIVLPISDGPLKGKRWILTSGTRFCSGRYEVEKTEAIARTVREGDIVFDIGAHVGYFTVLMSQRAGSAGKVFAFEPRRINNAFLRRHIKMNRCDNVEVFDTCVGRQNGTARLETRIGSGTGYVSPTGNVEVQMVSIDEMVAQGRLPAPTFLKIDVEGGEVDVLEGARQTIEAHRPRIILATHGDELDRQCQAFLSKLDYGFDAIDQLKGDKEVIATPR